MNVSSVMSRDLQPVAPDDSVAVVAERMLAQHLSAIPVVRPDGTLAGLVRANDLVARHARVHLPRYLALLGDVLPFYSRKDDEEIRHALAVTASDLMSGARTVTPDTSVEDAATILVDDGVEALPVIENGRVVGLLSEADILRLLVVEESDGIDTNA